MFHTYPVLAYDGFYRVPDITLPLDDAKALPSYSLACLEMRGKRDLIMEILHLIDRIVLRKPAKSPS